MDGLGPGIDQPGNRPGVARPGWHQTSAKQSDRTGAVLIDPTGGEVLPGRAIVAGLSIRRQQCSLQAVQVTNLIRGQLLGDTATHRWFLRPAAVPRSSCPGGAGWASRSSCRFCGGSSLSCLPCLDCKPSDLVVLLRRQALPRVASAATQRCGSGPQIAAPPSQQEALLDAIRRSRERTRCEVFLAW